MTAATLPQQHDRARRVVWRVAILVAAAAIAATIAWFWSAPREHVDVPGPEASPEDVVLAFAAALNARDFETVDAIDARIDEAPGRFSRTNRIDDIEINKVTEGGQRAHVVFTGDFSGWDASMGDGETVWGYYLERADDGSWRIVDAGVA